MMPRLLSLVLRRMVAGAALLAVILLAMFWPARHVLEPLWPDPVEEVLLLAPGDRVAERRFLPAGQKLATESVVLARNRPLTLWRLETDSGDVLHAWLQGVRDADSGELLEAVPSWLGRARVDGPAPQAVHLVMASADQQLIEVPGTSLARMFRPNGLGFRQRARLTRDRIVERWRWPFRSGDAGTSAPGR